MRTSSGDARPAPRPNLRDWVADELRERILDGSLAPGTRIDQDGVAAELGISKLPVREALIRLEWIGLVRTIPHRGSFVVELEPEDLRDTYRIYGMVCGLAAERAVQHLSADQLDALEVLLDRIDATGDSRELDAAHMDFHGRINRAGGSKRARQVIGQLLESLPVRDFDFTERWLADTQVEHRRILQLLRDGDGEAAAEAMEAHFIAGGERVIDALDARNYWSAATPDR